MRSLTSIVLFTGLFASALSGCGNGGDGASVVVGITAQALRTTDPAPSIAGQAEPRHLVVTVTEVSLHVEMSSASNSAIVKPALEKDTTTSGWIAAFTGKTQVDLFEAASREELLGSIDVPAGTITQVRLVFAGAELVDGATRTAVACPSCSESGLKILPEGKVEVAAGGALHLALDFDQTKSLSQNASGYQLDPVIEIADGS